MNIYQHEKSRPLNEALQSKHLKSSKQRTKSVTDASRFFIVITFLKSSPDFSQQCEYCFWYCQKPVFKYDKKKKNTELQWNSIIR